MHIVVTADAHDATLLLARLIARRLGEKPDLVVGLATGRTMEQVYTAFIAEIAARGLSCDRCRTFNLDEYCDLPVGDARSYRRFMHDHLFAAAGIDSARTHFPGEDAASMPMFEKSIRDAGGIDLQLLGIGENGHIGFNEPLSSFASRTRRVVLSQATRRQNAAMFADDASSVPGDAVTMGIATILEAREIVLLATGHAKAAIVARALEGPVSALVPASALHWHANCHVVLDEAAAAQLTGLADYRRQTDQDPFWAGLMGR